VVILILLITRCDRYDLTDSTLGTLSPIEGTILFKLVEGHLDPRIVGDPEIIIFMETEEDYPCHNFTISTDVYLQPDTVFFDLLGIYKPVICGDMLGPATFHSPVAVEVGEYSLIFRTESELDDYSMVVTDSSIHIQGRVSQAFIPEVNLAWRLPHNSFAYVCGSTEETTWICSDFYDSLMTIGSLQEFSFPDSGFIPYPDSSHGHNHDNAAVYFLYDSEADFDLVGAKLEEYNREIISQYLGVGIYLVNWRNKRYQSWLLEN
jgi:hypothetical protein